jgi:lipoprotein signal peptidase
MTRRVGRMALGLAMACAVLAADQASKYWILQGLDLPEKGDVPVLPPVLDFAMVYNHGVTFGLLQAGPGHGQLILAAIAIAVVAGLLYWLRSAETAITAAAIGAIAGGAIGNVVDRARLGMVVDFVHVHWGGFDPFPFVFNLGDSAIVVGVGILLLESVFPAPVRLQPPPPKA